MAPPESSSPKVAQACILGSGHDELRAWLVCDENLKVNDHTFSGGMARKDRWVPSTHEHGLVLRDGSNETKYRRAQKAVCCRLHRKDFAYPTESPADLMEKELTFYTLKENNRDICP